MNVQARLVAHQLVLTSQDPVSLDLVVTMDSVVFGSQRAAALAPRAPGLPKLLRSWRRPA
jgi:hypothetical protein